MPVKNTFLFISSALILLNITGCNKNTVSSTNLNTPGIYVIAAVASHGANQTKVTVDLSTGAKISADPVDLSSGDELIATSDTTSFTLTRAAKGRYEAVFPFNYSAPYTIALKRQAYIDAPSTLATLPVPFTINTPAANQVFLSGSAISLNWSPANFADAFSVKYNTTCTDTTGRHVNTVGIASHVDSGSLAIQSATLLPTQVGLDTTKSCLCNLTLTRERNGSVDPNYMGGSMVAKQIRSLSIVLNP